MEISSLLNINSSNIQNILGTDTGKNLTVETQSTQGDTFDSIYNSAVNMITSTNDYLQQASEAEVAYATGELTSTHELAVIEQEANLSLQYTVAIKNQLLSAYKEIMQIQI